MKILFICRLYSGFEDSLQSGVWEPKGAPTIARMIEYLDASSDNYDFHLIFTQKGMRDMYYPDRVKLDGLSTQARILKGHNHLPRWLWKFREKFSDLAQLFLILKAYHTIQPDIVYCDRVNILPAAILSRFTKARVIWRVMGVLEEMHNAVPSTCWRSRILKFMWRSPFKSVICTLDGSGGGSWMDQMLQEQIPRYLLLNGVSQTLTIQRVEGLPDDGVTMLFVGRLEVLKGIEEFMEACYVAVKRYNNLHAVIVGDGSLRDVLIQAAKDKGFEDRVHFLGAITASQLKFVRQNCDFYVSLNKQGNLSNVNLEALSDHLPTIVPSSDPDKGIDKDTDDLIPENVFYRFGKVGDIDALVSAIAYMMDQQNLNRYKAAARVCAAKILPSWDQRIRQELEIYNDVRPCDLAVVIADLGAGGAQKVAVSLVKELAGKNKKIVVITFQNEQDDFHILPGSVKRITLDYCNQYKGFFANVLRIYALRRVLKETMAHQVVSFIAPTNVLSVWACMGLDNQLVISERNDPARQSFGKMWDGLRKISYRFADVVTANSQNAIESLKCYVSLDRLQYVPNALSQPPQLDSKKKKIVLIVGRLHTQKAHSVLLDAFAQTRSQHPDWTLVIAGDGPLKDDLFAQTKALNIQNCVEFTGIVSNPYELYERASIFVLPSVHEGTPNALLEAMSCKCAPIISDACEGALSYVEHAQSGLVFPVNQSKELCTMLLKLMDNSDYCSEIAISARNKVEPLYSQSTLDLWKQALTLNHTNNKDALHVR